jgi:hypothetical protein
MSGRHWKDSWRTLRCGIGGNDRLVVAEPKRPAQWIAVFAAAIGVGLMHVGQVGNPADFWRIMTVNVIGHSVYGFLYWTRGFEVAVLTHVIVTSLLYIGVPALR